MTRPHAVVAPPRAAIFYVQELLPAFILMAFFQLASAAIFVPLVPGLDFGTAFYHCMISKCSRASNPIAQASQQEPAATNDSSPPAALPRRLLPFDSCLSTLAI